MKAAGEPSRMSFGQGTVLGLLLAVALPAGLSACAPAPDGVASTATGGVPGASGGGTPGGGTNGSGGTGGANTGTGGGASGSGGAGSVKVFPVGGPGPQTVPIRRLTISEYTASVTDLFPGITLPTLAFDNSTETQVLGYFNISSSQNSTAILAEQQVAASASIAKAATANPATLTGCAATTTSAAAAQLACAQPYLYGLAKRAYRRPVTTAEQTALTALFTADQTAVDYPTRLSLAVQAILLSPKFLFRPELGATLTAGVGPLTPWETATRLSYFLTGSMPDTALTAAADNNTLATPAQVVEQTKRLLATLRAQTNLVNFHTQWLGIGRVNALSKNATVYPSFTTSTALYMGMETRAFLQNVVFNQSGTFGDLFTANYSFVNAAMATFYGVKAPATDWGRVDLNPAQRQGLLTQPALLATMAKDDNTDPVRRGKFVLNQILCRSIASPSAALVAMFPPMDLSKTARDRFTAHRASVACASCHNVLDPLGLPFEHYDGIGQWRDNDRGMTLDVTGAVDGVPLDGIPAMENLLASKPEAASCYLTQEFMFALGKLKADVDQDLIDFLTQKFGRNTKIVDSVVNLVQSDGFRLMRSAQ